MAQPQLAAASNVINERLTRDEKITTVNLDNMQNAGEVEFLAKCLPACPHTANTASTSSEYAIATNAEWQPFQLRRSIPLPEALLDQYDGSPFARVLPPLFLTRACSNSKGSSVSNGNIPRNRKSLVCYRSPFGLVGLPGWASLRSGSSRARSVSIKETPL
jgi:hypothetical protein